MGESKWVEGGLGWIETEKNIANEINILRSNRLLKKTLKGLNFGVSYFTKKILTTREHYTDFPFTVEILENKSQLVSTPIQIEKISDKKYRISLEASNFRLSKFPEGQTTTFKDNINLSESHLFGDTLKYPYLNILVHFQNDASLKYDEEVKHFFVINDLQSLVRKYRRKLDIAQVDLQASILKLSTTCEIVDKDIKFLNHLSQNYIQSKAEERSKIALKKEEFIKSQLTSIADSLRKAEYNIASFRRRRNAIDLGTTGTQALKDIQTLQDEHSKINLNAQYYRSLLDYINDTSSINKIIAPSVVGIDDPLLNENLMEYTRLTAAKGRLEYTKGTESIDLRIINAQIDDTKEALKENIRNLIASTQLRSQNVGDRIHQVESTIKQLPSSERQLVGFERKSTLYGNLYNYLNQELAKTRIASAEDIPDIMILDEASVSGSGPVSPKSKLVMLLGIIIGFLLPAGFLALKDRGNETINSIQTLKKNSSIPVIAQIGVDRQARRKSPSGSDDWITRECFRDLDANIKFLHPRQNKTVLSITSMTVGEGKTFAALHLAQGMAAAGKRVLLVDVDFRKPSLSNILGVKEQHSFDNYLLENTDNYQSLIQSHDDYPNLEFITTNPAETNPHRLLQSPRFEYLILTLKDDYDYVILDCPAAGVVSDYLLMSHFIDIHLFILRQGRSSLSTIEEIHNLKKAGRIKHVYFVLNGVSKRRTRRKYYGYYKSFENKVLSTAIKEYEMSPLED